MEKTFADGWKIAKFVKVFSLKVSRYTVAVHVYIIPYSRKFSPGENFRLFRPGASWAKIFSVNYFTQWKFCHAEIFTRTGLYTWLPSCTSKRGRHGCNTRFLVSPLLFHTSGDRSCWGSRMCEYGTRYSGVTCSFESSTHYLLLSNSRCGRN